MAVETRDVVDRAVESLVLLGFMDTRVDNEATSCVEPWRRERERN